MEWLKGDDAHDMEVDIGYMEQMELRSTDPSRPANYEGYRQIIFIEATLQHHSQPQFACIGL